MTLMKPGHRPWRLQRLVPDDSSCCRFSAMTQRVESLQHVRNIGVSSQREVMWASSADEAVKPAQSGSPIFPSYTYHVQSKKRKLHHHHDHLSVPENSGFRIPSRHKWHRR